MTNSSRPRNDKEIHFAALAVDIVCFRIKDGMLMALLGKVQSENKFKGQFAHIGGLILPKETADEAIDRLLKDKAGITNFYKEQLYTFSEIDRDPRGRVVSVAYIALIHDETVHEDHGGFSHNIMWCPVTTLPKLGYDHDSITEVAINRLASKISYTNVIQFLLPKEFTLSELQKAYELILDRTLDKRNFRKKILALDMVKETGKTRKQGVMRPAGLYKFASQTVKVIPQI